MAMESCLRPLEDLPRHCACGQGLPQFPALTLWDPGDGFILFFLLCLYEIPVTDGYIHVHISSPVALDGIRAFLYISPYMWHFSYPAGPHSLWGNSGIICKSSLSACGLLSLEQHEEGGESSHPRALQRQRRWSIFVWSTQFLLTLGQNASEKPHDFARALGE